MLIFYAPNHTQHDPRYENYDGTLVPYAEKSERITNIAQHLEQSGYQLTAPQQFNDEQLRSIHHKSYIDYVKRRSSQLRNDDLIFPSYFITDTYAPLTSGTFAASRTAVDVALSGAEALRNGANVAYSLCRPPGHHATSRSMGGYCYFNNAAIAANHLSQHGSVAILDIDYHHGNGTQDIFYERDDVLYVSLHADPKNQYPYIHGYADETGAGRGEGFTLNIPLSKDTNITQYITALNDAIRQINVFNPDYLVVSLGFDTHSDDPIGGMQLTTSNYSKIAKVIAEIRIPTLLIQEGGYLVNELPRMAEAFIAGYEEERAADLL